MMVAVERIDGRVYVVLSRRLPPTGFQDPNSAGGGWDRTVLTPAEALQVRTWLDANLEWVAAEERDGRRSELAAEAEALRRKLAVIEKQIGHHPFVRKQRTVAEVEADRRNGPGGSGCCDRYADRMGCDCLSEALAYEKSLPKGTFPAGPKPRGPRPGDPPCRSLDEYDARYDNGCSICRDPNCDNPGGKH